jgi:translation initiation factor IF-2
MLTAILEQEEPEELLQEKPPVVTILGHVDHGKTSLLDKIRATNVVAGEAGGITQHIRSYQIDRGGRKITFVDTPGHAAFGEMRARGANVTDIVVLVVAANDSVMPQTVECIAHAKASGAPIIVAMNKMDLPNNNIDRVLTDLSTNGVQPQEWGGEIEVVRTSAETGDGIDDLLETILLTAEISELKANPDCNAVGLCLEAFQDEGVGPIAWLIIEKGTLRVGDNVVCGGSHGKIRAIYNDLGEMIQEAPPAMPVKVAGLNQVPGAGDHFFVMDDIETARSIAEDHFEAGRAEQLSGRGQPRTLDDILDAAREGAVQDLNLILKADTPGSIEAIKGELDKIDHPEVRVKVLHDAVGGVNESDIYLASASDAVIIAFHVIADDRAVQLAGSEGVDIRRYDIIYEVTDHIKQTLEGLLEPEKVQVQTGRAVVLQTFSISRTGTIAGCRVLSGLIERNNRVHVIRDQTILNDYSIASLKRVKDDAKEVREGMECGIRLDGFNDVKEGDLLEAFRIDKIKRTLEG